MPFQLGATFDESVFPEERDQDILERLSEAGFLSLELALHPRALSLGRADALRKNGNPHGFSFAFHAPDFADPSAFDLNTIMAPEGSRKAFKAWMDQCGDFGDEVQLVFHGASTESDTFRFVDFALEWIEKSRGSQILLLENTFSKSPTEVRFGQTGNALLKVIQTFTGSSLGLCLDTAHWLRTVNHGEFPLTLDSFGDPSAVAPDQDAASIEIPEPLLRNIRRVHVHSVDPHTGRDHQGLTGRDEVTALLLAPWVMRHMGLAEQTHKDSVLSVEVLASSLLEAHESLWVDAVLSSGAWLKGLRKTK